MSENEYDSFLDRINTEWPLYYGRNGQPITLREWTDSYRYPERKRVAQDDVGPLWISTVWLGLDHGMGGLHGGRPVIFETMIFYRGDDDGHPELKAQDMVCERYCTEAEALAGHAMVVSDMRRLVQNIEIAEEILSKAAQPPNEKGQ